MTTFTGYTELKWTGEGSIPAVGETVEVKMNGLGSGKVSGYFAESGFIGLVVDLDSPPEWYLKQNNNEFFPTHVFGTEL
tara:strand:+ start:1429 stop:1665 length:237 start_codon:yes stop_codon:yes gene_type:complete